MELSREPEAGLEPTTHGLQIPAREALYVAPEGLSRIAGNLIDIAMRHIPEGEQAAFVREVETFASTVGTR